GSMGDEIAYLQSEFRDFAAAIDERYPDADPRWSLVVYRDEGDAYVVEHEDFTDDAQAFRESLARRDANGGGDYPEAPERAFERANQLTWRSANSTAKLAFWVADAPPHPQNLHAFADSARGLKDTGVAIYPVASSGVDESTEYFMRATAQLTGGRYIFITNDSGIGLDHKEPTIDCYYVTLLRDALLRAIDAELLGTAELPTEEQVIRTLGEPDANGVCQLENETAHAF
ncbi:MAG: VWA domain-containing protein, partial [Polyangiales bacterium]